MDFKYITLTRLRDVLKISATNLPDAEALALIEEISESLNSLTGQFFQPKIEFHPASGKGDRLVHRSDLNPIINLISISVDYDKTFVKPSVWETMFGIRGRTHVYDISRVEVTPDSGYRLVSLISGEFPAGSGNVTLNGVFGWLQNRKLFQTELAAELAVDATTITVNEVSNSTGWVEVGDFVTITVTDATASNPARVYNDIIKAIDTSGPNPVLTVDKVQDMAGVFPIASGTTVNVYGRFPRALVEVMDALILRAWEESPLNPSGSGGSGSITDRLISEKVDNYSYQLESKSVQSSRYGGLGAITGSVRLDQTIRQYSRPPMVGFV